MAITDNQPTGTREKAAERRVNALRLRQNGASYQSIANALNVSKGTAYGDVKAALVQLAKREMQEAELLRQLELERLDALLVAIAPQLKAGHLGAIDRAVKISERRCKLLGLDAPTKADLTLSKKRPEDFTDDELAAIAGTAANPSAGSD